MPWTQKSVKRHSKAAARLPRRRAVWVRVANAALKRGAGEGSAIRQANAAAKRVRIKRRG